MVSNSPTLEVKDLEELKQTSNIILEPIETSIWQPPQEHPSQTLQSVSSIENSNSNSNSSSSSNRDGAEKAYIWDHYVHTWAKLGAWELVQYKRLVLLDCDMLVRINMDQLLNENP
ncbi:hypothetical protein BGZ50_002835 [Haplosporangium sp. Z 11]|nr:hypothetical protein BGZ50_002835 [Haplosporangium sp. Z 11]